MQSQEPFKNCPDVPCLIVAIAQPKPAKVIRPIRVEGNSISIRVPIVHVPPEAKVMPLRP